MVDFDFEAAMRKVVDTLEVAEEVCRNDKEIDFLESVLEQLGKRWALSQKQEDWLDDLYERACALP